jgi:hypothetical protein
MDLATIKQHQQAAWASGDYAAIGSRFPLIAELLCEAVDLRADERVLDVARGNGNAALAAARRSCQVTGRHLPPPPGVRPPVLWGSQERLRELFGPE